MITATDITVVLDKKRILDGVNFKAKPGEVTAIVGPNGSGKTTLLKVLTKEIRFTGKISINNRATESYKPWELAAIRGVLPQSATLAFPFTVQEVIRLGLSAGIHGERTEIVQQALSRVGLNGYENRTFNELSGGEQQRAHLARVLCQVWSPISNGEANWMLLDEPVASLDIAHQLQVMDMLRDFASRGGGVIAVMHDLNLTSIVADCIAILSKGTILAQDTPKRLLTDEVLSTAYGCQLRTNQVPTAKVRYILPQVAST